MSRRQSVRPAEVPINTRTTMGLVLAGLLSVAADAQAEPFVGRLGNATATVALNGTDGKMYQVVLELTALTPHGGSSSYTLDITIARCDIARCDAAKRYTASLDPSEVSAADDMSSVTVTARLLGTPLRVAWSSNSDSSATDTPAVSVVTAAGVVDAQQRTRDAAARVQAWGAKCQVTGKLRSTCLVASEFATDNAAAPPSTAPPQFVARGKRTVRCVR